MISGDIVRQLLNAYWLRPETALWRACDIRAMRQFRFVGPSLDIGCGDGVFSFLRAGGGLGPAFDVFQAMSNLERYSEGVDVYDASAPSLRVDIERRPAYGIDVAVDHKENLLNKARALGFYGRLERADANRKLPFAEASFRSIFSNILYWLDDPRAALGEIRRLLAPGGQACVLLPDSSLREGSFHWRLHTATGDARFAFLDSLDRGRLADNIRHTASGSQWRDAASQAGLAVLQHARYLSRPIVQIWDIGLRPVFPLLRRMVGELNSPVAMQIKREWIDLFAHYVEPLAALEPELDPGGEPAFHCFILQRES